jgi:hypothetical protein
MRQYSLKDLVGTLTTPAGAFPIAGQIGLNSLLISNAIEHVTQQVSGDGTVMVSWASGRNGHAGIDVQQTSDLHKFLIDSFNLIQVAADAGDTSLVAISTFSFRNIVDNSYGILTGMSISKIPDVPRGSQGQNVMWMLPAADLVSG